MVEIYIINLKKDKDRYYRTLNELSSINYPKEKINRFNALTINDINLNNKHIHQSTKIILPDKLIAISMSHIELSKYLLSKNLDYALVLEDDIKVIHKKLNLEKELENIINNTPKNWDIIQIYYQGIKNKYFELCGSAAAYLISKSGMEKMSKLKFNYHIDMNMQSKYFNNYKSKQLLTTYEKKFGNKLFDKEEKLYGNKSLYFWYNQNTFKIPFINKNLNFYEFLLFILLLIIIIFLVKNKYIKYLILFYIINVLSFIQYSLNIKNNNFIKKLNYIIILNILFIMIYFKNNKNKYILNLIIVFIFYIINILIHNQIYNKF